MMIERGMTNKELLQVSAYIDEALSPKEKRAFEAHLETSATLQKELFDYKRLKAAMRSLPQKKAPRNFTLSPEKVTVRKAASHLAPAFSFASAGVAILLMLAFGSEYLLGRSPLMISKEVAEPQAFMLESAPAADATEPAIIFWNSVPLGMGGGGAEEKMGIGGGPMLGSAEDVPMIVSVPPEDQRISEGSSSTIVEDVEERETLILGLSTDETSDDATRQVGWFRTAINSMASWSIIRWVQVGLGALLLGFGTAAIVFWNKKRR